MDYIWIKNEDSWVRSDSITGLLIASLPPAVRAGKRIQIEQIDGRDGDIITDLGYEAYDKPLGIALYGDYDTQDVLDYFKPNGQVIFSDDPDKYYDYMITQATSLERVIRFKKGIVTFHVQPYRFLKDEPVLTFNGSSGNETVTNSGNTESKPIIKVYGSGTINITINGIPAIAVTMGNQTSITIDSFELEAYNDSGTLMNRQITSDYDLVKFNSGANIFSWSGSATKIEISKYSRWI